MDDFSARYCRVAVNDCRQTPILTPQRQMTWTFAQVIEGGAEGTRTPDPHTASVVRYQLRHGPARLPRQALARYYTPPGGGSHRHSETRPSEVS